MVEIMRPSDHWEPPDGRKLLVTSHRVAEVLDVPQWKAQELCHVLEQLFFAEGRVHYRVTQSSLDAMKDLLDQGLSMAAAREVMWRFKSQGSLPPIVEADQLPIVTTRRRRRRW